MGFQHDIDKDCERLQLVFRFLHASEEIMTLTVHFIVELVA